MVETEDLTSLETREAAWFRVLAESTSAAIIVYREDVMLYANPAASALLGRSDLEGIDKGELWQAVAEEHRSRVARHALAPLAGDDAGGRVEFRLIRTDGSVRWVEFTASPIAFDGESAALATAVDITDRREAQQALAREKERAQVTLASIGDGVIRTDSAGSIDYMNPVAEEITGWSLGEALGLPAQQVYEVIAEASRRPRTDPVKLCLTEGRTVALPGLFALRSRSGREFVIRDSVAPIFDRDGKIAGTVLVFKDMTQLRGLEEQMAYLASHDGLTGLYNRMEFEIHLEAALESARDKSASHVLLVVDVQRFKLVNDVCGHAAGDELLRQVATLLRSKLRQEDAVARLGADEFGLLLKGCPVSEARKLASSLRDHLRSHPFEWGGQTFELSVSVGLVRISASSHSVMEVLKAADTACYLAAESGGSGIHELVPDDHALAEHYGQLQWIHRFRKAVAENRFCLYRQMIRPLNGHAAGPLHEILVRFVDEGGEHLSPSVFIPAVERYKIAPTLDRWVVGRTLELLGPRGALGNDSVSINLSGQSLGDEAFLDFCLDRLDQSGIDPGRIFFEITETAAVANLAQALRFMTVLKEKGCRFILDDFGSGLSSFAYLRNLPVDLLKIDGEFVRSMEDDAIRRAMVQSINQIGQVMGLATIAEWVESEATYDLLTSLEVNYVQGYWVHRPEPIESA